jgi:hypothetical protein
MTENRPEEAAKEVANEMERSGDQMEHELKRLDSHIGDAKDAASKRQEAGSDALEDAAGDWEDEATGSQQGEDPEDTESEKAPEAHDREGSTEEDADED